MMRPMRLGPLVVSLALVAIAAKLVELGVTREGVGPLEYLTLVALIALLLLKAHGLGRQALGASNRT
jgi:hypothetical protein